MQLAQAPDPVQVECAFSQSWWLEAPTLCHALKSQYPAPKCSSVCYRLGDSVLRLTSDNARLLGTFEQMYGDCAVTSDSPDKANVHCMALRGGEPPMLLLTFLKGGAGDLASAFLPKREMRVWDSPLSGWRLAGNSDGPMIAACGSDVLMHSERAWREFPVEYLVNVTLSSQFNLFAVHAASVETSKGALLLAGRSHAGKSTTALHLAARGHTLLGDEVALLRLESNEVLPFRRTTNLRPGPRGRDLLAAIARIPGDYEPTEDGGLVRKLRISELFPGSQARSTNLRAVFFLDGFSDHPHLTPFQPTMNDLGNYGILAGNEIATLWSLPPQRRALRLMALKHMLHGISCWRLEVGSPDETGDLIERIMEGC